MTLIFYPRGGSAQVARYLSRALMEVVGVGEHYLEYAVSGVLPDLAWTVTVTIDGVVRATDVPIDRYNPVRVAFMVGDGPPSFPWMSLLPIALSLAVGTLFAIASAASES